MDADPKNLAYLDALVAENVVTHAEAEKLLNNGLLPVDGLPHSEVRELVDLATRLAKAREAMRAVGLLRS